MTLDYDSGRTVATRIGNKPTASAFKPFLVGPIDQEVTGLCESSDGKVLFVNVQHPGAKKPFGEVGDPSNYSNHWPSNASYGAVGATARPRSCTVMVTENDGGRIGT